MQVSQPSPPRNLPAATGLELQQNNYTPISDEGMDHSALCQRRPSSIGRHLGQYATYGSSMHHFVHGNLQSLTPVTEGPIQNNFTERDETSQENPWKERQRTNAIASLVGTLNLITGLWRSILMETSKYRFRGGHLTRERQSCKFPCRSTS